MTWMMSKGEMMTSMTSRRNYSTGTVNVLSEDSKSDMLAAMDYVQKVWNDGSLNEAVKLAREELDSVSQLIQSGEYGGDVRSTRFLDQFRFDIQERLANMLLVMNQYVDALVLYKQCIEQAKNEYDSYDSDQKKYNRTQYMRSRVQLVIRAAECLRRCHKFDDAVRVLLDMCDEMADEPMLLICLRERLGWYYSQRAVDLTAQMMSLTPAEKAKKIAMLEDVQSHYRQSIHHLDVAVALSKQIGTEENYIEFSSDDVRSVIDTLFCRGLCYKDLASLAPTREESDRLYKLAITDLLEVIQKEPKFYAAYFNCADCCAKVRDHSAAIGLYDFFMENFQEYVKQIRERGDDLTRIEELYIEVRIKRAVCTINNEDFPMAQDELKELVFLIDDFLAYPDSTDLNEERLLQYKAIAHNKLGYCYYRRYKYREAIEENTKAIRINPSMMEAYRDRCECYECLSFETEAAEDRRMVEYLKRKIALNQ